MRIPTFPVTCQVCGEIGYGNINCSVAEWNVNSFISHKDPRVCAANIQRKNLDAQAKEQNADSA